MTVDDGRSRPVPFTGLRIIHAGTHPETLDHPVTLGARDESRGSTRLTLDLGAANLHLAELRLDIADPVFSRSCSLSYPVPSRDAEATEKKLATGSIFRVVGEGGAATQQLAIPIHARVPARSVVVTIDNGDSPPLAIKAAAATRYPTTLVFFAPQAGKWTLLTGNRRATAPRYDLARLRGDLGKAGGTRITPGPLASKDDFQPPPALPDIDPAGAGIDLADWSFRRSVEAPAGGVIRIEPDALTLANSRSDLGDLRVVQNGRQVPFLVVPSTKLRPLTPELADDPDEKRPGVSRWMITMPVDGLPAQEITARSPDPLFTRTFRAVTEGRDSLGNRWTRTIGTATWTRSGGADDNRSGLVLELGGSAPAPLVSPRDRQRRQPGHRDHRRRRALRHAVTRPQAQRPRPARPLLRQSDGRRAPLRPRPGAGGTARRRPANRHPRRGAGAPTRLVPQRRRCQRRLAMALARPRVGRRRPPRHRRQAPPARHGTVARADWQGPLSERSGFLRRAPALAWSGPPS